MNLPVGWTIRIATAADAPEIAAVLAASWPHDTPDPARIARVLSASGRATLCACGAGAVAGFVDAFATSSADGVPRWEIDLLAVRSTARGMGLGRALIEAAVSLAPAEAQLARALVRMDNTAAERTFTTAGFSASEARVTLYTATPQALQPQVSAVYAIQVETLTYSGLWLERAITGETLRAARNTAAEQSLDVVGVLTPACDITEEDCHEAGFTQVAEYRWWQRGLEHRLGERGRDVIATADDDGRDAR